MATATWVDSVSAGAGVVTGRIARINAAGDVMVALAGGEPVGARWLASVKHDELQAAMSRGAEVVCLLEEGHPVKPIIIGVIATSDAAATDTESPVIATVDGQRVCLTGKDEVTLKCGKASITLTRAGKILLRGTHLLSRSSGVNRIKGGSVQIN
jgi:hypothetical protein